MLYNLFSFLLSTPANMRWKNKEIHFQLQKFYHYSLSKCSFMEMFLFEQSNSLQVIFEQSNNIKRFASIQINNLKLNQANNWRNQKYPKKCQSKSNHKYDWVKVKVKWFWRKRCIESEDLGAQCLVVTSALFIGGIFLIEASIKRLQRALFQPTSASN